MNRIKEFLSAIKKEDAASVIRRSLGDSHAGVRAFAAAEIGKQPEGSQNVALLLPLLKDEHPAVRAAAARSLGGIGDSSAGEAMLALADEPEETVRRFIYRALGTVGDERGAPMLANALDAEGKTDLRREAVAALGKLRAVQAIPRLGEMLTPGLPLLGDALQALGAIGHSDAIPFVLKVIEEGLDPFQEWYAVAALRDINDRDEIKKLVLDHPSPIVRQVLVRVLGEWWPEPDVVRVLLRTLEDPGDEVRSAAAFRVNDYALAPELHAEVREALEKRLSDSNADVRHWAQNNLDKWGVDDDDNDDDE